jgi:UPF0716 family protein affecting phage T7 exclusion
MFLLYFGLFIVGAIFGYAIHLMLTLMSAYSGTMRISSEGEKLVYSLELPNRHRSEGRFQSRVKLRL